MSNISNINEHSEDDVEHDNSLLNASFTSTSSSSSNEYAQPSSQIAIAAKLQRHCINNRVDLAYDSESEEHEGGLIDLDLINSSLDPRSLYNNPIYLANFLDNILFPFLCWSMIANITSWFTSAGSGFIDTRWFMTNRARRLFNEALALAMSRFALSIARLGTSLIATPNALALLLRIACVIASLNPAFFN